MKVARLRAVCEKTGKEIDFRKGFLVADIKTGEWSFVCHQAEELNPDYAVPVRDLFRSKACFLEWMEHLQHKIRFRLEALFDHLARLSPNHVRTISRRVTNE